MKSLLMWACLLAYSGCGQTSSKDNKDMSAQLTKPDQYVSMDCEKGDITLSLNPDQTFELAILFWDNATHQHKGQERLKGIWKMEDSIFTLEA